MKRFLAITAASLLALGAADLSGCKKAADNANSAPPPVADNGSAAAQDTNAEATNVAIGGNAAATGAGSNAPATNSSAPY
jgi:hypothetical protein